MAIIRLEKLLKASTESPLEQLVQRAESMDRLTSSLREALDPELAPRLKGVNLRPDGQLILVAESPGWAARLRFESDILLATARDSGAQVSSCKVIVARE